MISRVKVGLFSHFYCIISTLRVLRLVPRKALLMHFVNPAEPYSLSSCTFLFQFHIYTRPILYHLLIKTSSKQGVKSKLGSLYSVLLRFFHFGLYLIKLTFTFLLFDYCINCRLDEVRMILSVSPV